MYVICVYVWVNKCIRFAFKSLSSSEPNVSTILSTLNVSQLVLTMRIERMFPFPLVSLSVVVSLFISFISFHFSFVCLIRLRFRITFDLFLWNFLLSMQWTLNVSMFGIISGIFSAVIKYKFNKQTMQCHHSMICESNQKMNNGMKTEKRLPILCTQPELNIIFFSNLRDQRRNKLK